ncbi:Transposase DDE domain protein [compost metagenome]
MLFTNDSKPQLDYELVCLEYMVDPDHLLRKVDAYIDFSFILDIVAPYYCTNNGRPSLDPIVFFKMLLIGYLYNIRSERELERVVNDSFAFRWFLGLGLTRKAPDHSTFSWNRKNRFKGTNVFQEIFDRIVEQAITHRMVGGRLLITDSTHMKANASNNRYEKQEVVISPNEYLKELDQAVDEDRVNHGKKPFDREKEVLETKTIKVSLTDPESGYLQRDGKPEGFHYLNHCTVDHKFNIITDCCVTAGNVNDSTVYIDRLNHQVKKFKWHGTMETVLLDSGYMTPYICYKTTTDGITAIIAERKVREYGVFAKSQFDYDHERDVYICPGQQELAYRTTRRDGNRDYKSNPAVCRSCSLLQQCTTNKDQQRTIQRHIWEEQKEIVTQEWQSENGKRIYKIRATTIERSFADAKVLHGLRYARFRGRERVQIQALLTATAQNIKRIAMHLAKVERGGNPRKIVYLHPVEMLHFTWNTIAC